MPDTQNRNEDVFAKYNAMSTEELQQILREDASKPEGQEETSTEALFYIMEVLAQRRRARNEGKTPEEALEAFHKYYEEDEVSSLTEREPVVRKKNSTATNWVKRLVASAAIIILIFSGSITAKAFGFDLWEIIVKWTQETFHFGEWGNSNADDSLPYTSLQNMLEEGEITTSLVPCWFPDGYELADINVERKPNQIAYKAKYTNDDQVLIIMIRDYLDKVPVYVEQSEGLVEEYEVAGITYYLFENYEYSRAVWLYESYECDISGEVTIDDLKKMIDSVQKG